VIPVHDVIPVKDRLKLKLLLIPVQVLLILGIAVG